MSGFTETMDIIKNAVKSVDEKCFSKLTDSCVMALNSGKKIVVSGLGKNAHVCEKFVGTMVSLGQDAVFMDSNAATHGDIGMVKSGDLVIVLTKSGETAESVRLVTLLQERECEIWLVTFNKKSTLARKIENTLCIDLEKEGDVWDIVPNNSTTVNLIVLQELALKIAEKRGVTLADFKKNHPGGHIGKQLKSI